MVDSMKKGNQNKKITPLLLNKERVKTYSVHIRAVCDAIRQLDTVILQSLVFPLVWGQDGSFNAVLCWVWDNY